MDDPKSTIYLSISGFDIAISFEKSEEYLAKIAARRLKSSIKNLYKGYISKKKLKTDFEIRLVGTTIGPPLLKKDSMVYGLFFKKESEKKYVCTTGITIYQFGVVLRNAILTLLQDKSGFMIHSSSVEIGKQAYVFVGKSGAGKTTTMRLLSTKFKPLGDDSSIIKKEDGAYFSYQTPLIENYWPIERSGKKYSLGKIIFLKKSKAFRLEKMKGKTKILQLLTKQMVCEQDKLKLYLPSLFDFTNNFDQFYTMHFDKKPSKLIKLLENS